MNGFPSYAGRFSLLSSALLFEMTLNQAFVIRERNSTLYNDDVLIGVRNNRKNFKSDQTRFNIRKSGHFDKNSFVTAYYEELIGL